MVAWLTPDEYAAVKREGPSARLARELVASRMAVVGPVDLTNGEVVREVQVPRGDRVLWAWLDVCGEFMRTVFAEGGCTGTLDGFGEPVRAAPGATTKVVFSQQTKPSMAEKCDGDRKLLLRVADPTVVGTMGNPPERRLCAHLPRSYASSSRRYPVIYVLSGLMGTDTTRLIGGKVDELADQLMTTPEREVILIGVDTSTRGGSTYLVDSTASGAFDTFFAKTMIGFVDQNLRTIASPRARALVGQSTGGFNAISAALRHSDVFSAVAATSPDGLDLASWLLTPRGDAIVPDWLHWMRFEDRVGGGGQMVSYAAEWSPDPSSPRGFAWPADLASGKLIPSVWAKWLSQSPVELLRQPSIAAGVRANLNHRIYVTVGRDDEFGLHGPAARFSDALRAMGVDHTFLTTEGGHFAGLVARQSAALEHCIRLLSTPA